MAGKFGFLQLTHQTGSFDTVFFAIRAIIAQQSAKIGERILARSRIAALQHQSNGGPPGLGFKTFAQRQDDGNGSLF
jgi:hypothetical protein